MEIKEKLDVLEDKLNKGLKGSYKKMVEFKKYKKSPIIVDRDGKVVKINPEDVQLEK